MKVLILNSLYEPHDIGGAERSVQIMAEGLKARGIEPVVVTTADWDGVNDVGGIKVHYLRIPNLYWMRTAKNQPTYKKPFWHLIDSYNPFVTRKLAEIIEIEKPDLFHSNNLAGFSVYAWKVAARFNLPIVHTIRDHYLLCPNSVMYRRSKNCDKQCLRCRLFSISRKKLSSMVDAVIGVSQFILNKHLRFGYFKSSMIRTHIYSPVNLNSNPESAGDYDDIVTFGYVGMLAPIKGVEFLLERFTKMNLANARLKIFGRGITQHYEDYLIDRYRSDNIIFIGHKKPEEIYPTVNIVIIPSLCDDAFPRTLMESYSYGVPVIGTNMGGVSEMISKNITGFVFDPGKTGDLEEKIRLFANDVKLSDRMSTDCLEAAKEFGLEKMTEKMKDLYEQVVVVEKP